MSKPSVVPLRGDPESVIESLERWLELARSGELRAIALVGVRLGGTVSTEWTSSDMDHRHALVAGASYLHHRMVAQAVGD
jgi:predicted esterase YcpF (UPF0227 family)